MNFSSFQVSSLELGAALRFFEGGPKNSSNSASVVGDFKENA